MTEPVLDDWLRHLRGFLHADQTRTLTDAELVRQFATTRDERAFAVLLERHGPLVLGVCRRMLGAGADADDAFQATFLVLVQKAHTLTQWGCLANWLHAVACRVALKSRARSLKRQRREQPLTNAPEPHTTTPNTNELRQVLDQELAALPTKYRLPLLLCYFEGLSTADAARQLGCPLGTLSGRMARGRALLGRRLSRRGLAVPVALATFLAHEATGTHLLATTIRAFQQPATVSTPIVQLASATMRGMHGPRLGWWASLALSLTIVSGLVWAGMQETTSTPPPPTLAPRAKRTDSPKLADGAVARWGTTAWRHANLATVVPTPDGQQILSAGAEGVRVWNRQGELVRSLLTPNERLVELAVAADGATIVGYGQRVHVWDAMTGAERFTVDVGELTRHHRVTFDATGKRLLVIEEHRLRQWDTRTGKALGEPADMPAFRLFGEVHYNAANHGVAIMNCNSPTYLIDLKTGTERLVLQEPRRHLIGAMAFSGDGKILAGALDPTIRIIDPKTGQERHSIKTALADVPRRLALSERGELLAVLGSTEPKKGPRRPANSLVLLDTHTGKERRSFSLAPRDTDDCATPENITLTADHQTLIGWDQSTIYVWDTTTGERLRPEGTWHRAKTISVSRDGQRWATSSDQSEYVRVYDRTGQQLLAVKGTKPELSTDGSLLLVVPQSHQEVELWDIARKKRLRTWTPHPDQKLDSGHVGRAVFLTDGQRIMTMGSGGIHGLGGTVAFWSISDGHEVRRVGPVGDILAWSADGNRLLSRDADYSSKREQQMNVWDLERGQSTDSLDDLRGIKIVPRDPAALSPDGTRIAAVDHNSGRLGIWNLTSGRRVHTLSEKNEGGANVVWSPDGRYLATTNQGHDEVRIWDTKTGQCWRSFRTYQGLWPQGQFSGDSRQFLTIGADTTTMAWDVEAFRQAAK